MRIRLCARAAAWIIRQSRRLMRFIPRCAARQMAAAKWGLEKYCHPTTHSSRADQRNPDSIIVHLRGDHVRWAIQVRGATPRYRTRAFLVSRLGVDSRGHRAVAEGRPNDDQSNNYRR